MTSLTSQQRLAFVQSLESFLKNQGMAVAEFCATFKVRKDRVDRWLDAKCLPHSKIITELQAAMEAYNLPVQPELPFDAPESRRDRIATAILCSMIEYGMVPSQNEQCSRDAIAWADIHIRNLDKKLN